MPEVALYDHATSSDMMLAMEISNVLSREYPGHKFMVHADSSPSVGMVLIQHWQLSENEGYRLRITELHSPDAIKKAAIRAAGEILERFNVARGKADQDQLKVLERFARFR